MPLFYQAQACHSTGVRRTLTFDALAYCSDERKSFSRPSPGFHALKLSPVAAFWDAVIIRKPAALVPTLCEHRRFQ
jgi:hypothetical protein